MCVDVPVAEASRSIGTGHDVAIVAPGCPPGLIAGQQSVSSAEQPCGGSKGGGEGEENLTNGASIVHDNAGSPDVVPGARDRGH
jgi:hypothetical protein